MTNNLQCSMSRSWAVVAISAILTLSGCGQALQPHGQLFPPDPFGLQPPNAQHRQVSYQDDAYYDEGFDSGFDAGFDEGFDGGYSGDPFADGPIYDDSYLASDHHGYDCFECGPGRPGPIRGLIHDLFHHLKPVARAAQALLCHRCGQHVDDCACQGPAHHGYAGHGPFERPPIPVENAVGPCWGYYQTAWRRFPPHCPNVPVPVEPHLPPEALPEDIGPGENGPMQDDTSGPAIGPGSLPSPTNGDGFQSANPNRQKDWQTARGDNPLREEAGQTRTAWKPPARMTWLPLRTADQRNWRKPNEEGSVVR